MARRPLLAVALFLSVAVLAMLVATAISYFARTPGKPSDEPPGSIVAPAPAGAAASPAAPSSGGQDGGQRQSLPPVPLELGGPERTLHTQFTQLVAGDFTGFQATFLPSVEVTREEFRACQQKVRAEKLRPDWDLTIERKVDGHRVMRVPIYGRKLTGFHEIDGSWRADRVWCSP